MKTISVIVPCLNEESTISLLLAAIAKQNYPIDLLEVIIADGMSTDNTREEISRFQLENKSLRIELIDNLGRSIPAGLNMAIKQAQGDVILRLDAHSVPDPDYIVNCAKDLEAKKGWNVGGLWIIQPGGESWIAESIALAAAHPVGIGDAHYRYSSKAQSVDTVPFGSFNKALFDEIGLFDESMDSNEDYEFNARIRAKGGTIWFNPAIRSVYFARPDIRQLARQYSRYGFWKWRMLQRFPASIRWRQALPPLFVLGLVFGPILIIVWPWLSLPWLAAVVSYALLLLAIGLGKSLQKADVKILFGMPAAMFTMHISYGSALIWSIIHSAISRD